MPPRDEAPDVVRVVEGISGRVPMHGELRLRFDYGRVVPWVRRVDGQLVGGGRAGLGLAEHARRRCRGGTWPPTPSSPSPPASGCRSC